MAVGLTLRSDLGVHGPAQLARGDLHASGRPAIEQVDVGREDKSEDSDDVHVPLLAIEQVRFLQLQTESSSCPVLEQRSLASFRIREGHGPRGPPLA